MITMSNEIVKNLYDQITQRLIKKDHAKLLEKVLGWQEKGGGKTVKNRVKEVIKEIEEREE